MKKLIMLSLLALSTSSAFANILYCATAVGGYNEVEKFQIVNFSEVRMGNRILDSFCTANELNFVECDFIADRLRGYTVKVDLRSGRGVIAQNFRASHQVDCQY